GSSERSNHAAWPSQISSRNVARRLESNARRQRRYRRRPKLRTMDPPLRRTSFAPITPSIIALPPVRAPCPRGSPRLWQGSFQLVLRGLAEDGGAHRARKPSRKCNGGGRIEPPAAGTRVIRRNATLRIPATAPIASLEDCASNRPGRHHAVRSRRAEGATGGQHNVPGRLLDGHRAGGERHVGDGLGPVRVGASGRAGDRRYRRGRRDVEVDVAVLDRARGNRLPPRQRYLGGILSWCLVPTLVGAGGGGVAGGREPDHQIFHSQSGERSSSRQRQAVVRERWLAMVELQVNARGKRDRAEADHQDCRANGQSVHDFLPVSQRQESRHMPMIESVWKRHPGRWPAPDRARVIDCQEALGAPVPQSETRSTRLLTVVLKEVRERARYCFAGRRGGQPNAKSVEALAPGGAGAFR